MDCVINAVSHVEQASADGLLSGAVFLDVKPAYDTTSHNHVLHGLFTMDVTGRALRWISDFLRDRTVYVKTSEGETLRHGTAAGVPQGSILSPLLFNVVMAALPSILPRGVNVSLYADDICIWSSGKQRRALQRRLQSALDIVASFLAERERRVTHHRFIGLNLDRSLSWRAEVRCFKDRAESRMNVLRYLCGTRWGLTCGALFGLHRSLVRQVLTYHLPVLHHLCPTSEQLLETILAKSIKTCLGVHKSTSTALVFAGAKEPPVPIMRLDQSLSHYLRLATRHHRHPLVRALTRRPASGYSQAVLAHRSIIPKHKSLPKHPDPLWALPTPPVCVEVPGVSSKKTASTVVLRQLTLAVLDSDIGKIQVFTDASTTRSGSACAYVIPQLSAEGCARLSHRTSAAAAELHAICMALVFIASSPSPAQWSIYTDSKAALQGLLYSTGSCLQWCMTSLTYASPVSRGHDIQLQWVPGHCGVPGNEAADAAARRAHLARGVRMHLVYFTRGDAKSTINAVVKRLSGEHWRRCVPVNALLRKVDPDLQFLMPPALPRAVTSIIHRLRLNVPYTGRLLFKLGKVSTPNCSECGVLEDTEHVIEACPRYRDPRLSLEAALARLDNRPFSVGKVLGCRPAQHQVPALRALVDFLTASDLLDTL
ncbi:uncharacterized protein LOC135384720 [Ornithodoros turicata]|uniref:uncharacterized protein LOC135384720 n=1 Tax=Ornithodoros turicata TaxID=34597 RepID=UPI0031390ABA